MDTVSPTLYNVHADHLGRPTELTDAAKASVWDAVWLPFGGAHSITGTLTHEHRRPGQWFQLEAGLHYNWHRHYDPSIGRYTQPDPLGFVDGPSQYAYARSNPQMLVDPKGLDVDAALPAIVPAAMAFCVAGPVSCAIAIGGSIAIGIMCMKPPKDAHDPDGAKAPGKPGEAEGFKDPKGGEDWVKNPNGSGNGWLDSKGDVWVPTGQGGSAHGGPHWDVQSPKGGYRNVRPKR